MEQKKLTLEEFNEYKNKLAAMIAELETVNEQNEDNEDFDEEKAEQEFMEKYFSLQSELLSYDLSDIPFEAWEDMAIAGFDEHIADFSKTKANIDFELLSLEGDDFKYNFKGCNVKNVEAEHCNKEMFDEATINKYPDLFLSDQFDKDFENKYYTKTLTIEDLSSLSSEQLEELKNKNLLNRFEYITGSLIDKVGLQKAVQLYHFSKKDYQAVYEIEEYTHRLGFCCDNLDLINEFDERISSVDVSEIKKEYYSYIANAVLNSRSINIGKLPESFVKENSDILLTGDNIPNDLRQRYYAKELTVYDVLNNISLFKNIPIDKFCKDDKIQDLSKALSGGTRLQQCLEAYPKLFNYIIKGNLSREFLTYFDTDSVDFSDNTHFKEQLGKSLSSFFEKFNELKNKEQLMLYDPSLFELDENQKLVFDTFNLKNIKKMEKENNFFFNDQNSYNKPLLNQFANFFKNYNQTYLAENGIDFKNGTLNYQDFLNQLAKCFNYMRKERLITDYSTIYDHIQGEFRNNYPEIFIDSNAPETLKKAFYSQTLSLYNLYKHPEYYHYLLNKNLAEGIDHIPKLRTSIVDSEGYPSFKDTNFIQEYTSRYGNEKFLQLVSKYGNFLADLEISNENGEIESEQEIEKAIRNAIYDKITDPMIDRIDYSNLENNPEFVSEHPEIFIDANTPETLKKDFYSQNLTFKTLYEHPEYYHYLQNKRLSLAMGSFRRYGLSLEVASHKYTNFVQEYTSRYGNEKFFQLISKYGNFFGELSISSRNGEIESEQEIEKSIRDAVYGKIARCGVDYSNLENNQEFVSEHPEIFLKENVPLEIKKKFYSRSLSMADFVQNPNLVDILNNTNVVFGFPFEYMFTNELFAEKDFKTANLKRFKIISEMAQIEARKLREKYKIYIKKHKDNLNMETLSSLKNVLKRVEYSNSSELRSFRDNFAEKLLNLDDPIAGLEKIEKVFIQNNLPFFAKMFLSFQHIYPDFTKGNVFNFSDTSRIAPQLKDQSLPDIGYHLTPVEKRFRIIYNDLLRITYRSGSLDLMEYLHQLETGNDLFINYMNNGFKQDNFSKEDKQTFDVFMSHLETMYENLSKEDIHDLPLEEKSKILYKTFEPNARYDFKDRVVRTFCYSAGITTFNQLKELVISSKKEADERGRKYAEELSNKPFEFEEGDFFRGMGDFESLSGSLAIGNVCKEQLISIKQTSDTDRTPLDIDITLVNNKPSDIYHAVNDTPTGFGFGNVYQIIKKDNPNFVITRDKDGNLTNEPYNPLKAELFGTHIKETGAGYETHWGARTGVAMTDIDYLLYKQDRIIDRNKPYDENGDVNYTKVDSNIEINSQEKKDYELDLDIIKYEIAKNGFYLPVIDFSGKLIYSVEEYENIRNMMQGLSHYGVSEYKLSDHLNLPECPISSELTLPSSEWISSQLKETNQETVIKREKIKQVLKPVFDEFNLSIKEEIDGDLTPGSVEFIDTGSTGRGTNKPHDGDFDFLLRLDNDLLLDFDKQNRFMARLREVIETYPHSNESFTTDNGDFRYKKVKLDEETTIDLDLSFVGKTNKVMYSSDMCVKDRLATIKKQYPEQYDLVVANIIQAKMFLKSQGVYKPFRSDKTQGGLGGIGVENWILQHGGSFLDAAISFVQASEGKDFAQFKKDYQIWDFGANHFADRKISNSNELYKKIDAYPYDNFVAKNMSEAGYNKMRQALKQFLNSYTIVNNQNYSIETENDISIVR